MKRLTNFRYAKRYDPNSGSFKDSLHKLNERRIPPLKPLIIMLPAEDVLTSSHPRSRTMRGAAQLRSVSALLAQAGRRTTRYSARVPAPVLATPRAVGPTLMARHAPTTTGLRFMSAKPEKVRPRVPGIDCVPGPVRCCGAVQTQRFGDARGRSFLIEPEDLTSIYISAQICPSLHPITVCSRRLVRAYSTSYVLN